MKYLVLIFLLTIQVSIAQEIVSDLHFNTSLPAEVPLAHRSESSLTLPFYDDFSTYTGYPNQVLWNDFDAYVNTTYPIFPLNIGVATLEGLDSLGNPRNISSPTSHGLADFLTSNPIDLSAETEVYLSFSFQAGGYGNFPEENDVLCLEFLNNETNEWDLIWDTVAFEQLSFESVDIVITNDNYFFESFQFRFKNYATLSGNFDHWHLDNVLLTNDYTLFTDKEDVSFAYNPTSVLNEYQSMPWQHFLQNQSAHMANNMDVVLVNNYSTTQSVDYKYDVFNEEEEEVFHYPTTGETRNDNIHSVFNNGMYSYTNDSETAITLYDYVFNANNENSSLYTFIHSLKTDDSDHFKTNDTLRISQNFQNFYAYDDGTAEASYGINAYGGMAAMKFNIAKQGILTHIQIYFAQNLEPSIDIPFRFSLWENNQGVPGDSIIYQSQELYPLFTNSQNGFYEYQFETPIFLNEGPVFIGWQQYDNTLINVGLDKNNIHNDKLFFNIGSGWENSICADCDGVWMIRPVFGNPSSSSITDLPEKEVNIYPNPMKEMVEVSFHKPFSLSIYNIKGQLVKSFPVQRTSFNIYREGLSNGLYILDISTKNNTYKEKLIVQ